MRETGDCTSEPFADIQLALHLRSTPEAFTLYLGGRRQLLEKELARDADERLQLELKKLTEMDEQQREVLSAHRHITENIINLKCPRCKAVFVDFEGCFAVKCSSCPCGFCAWCFADCGSDAHPHVMQCPHKPPGNSSRTYYGTAAEFEAQNLRRRKKMLCEFVGGLKPQIRQSVLHGMVKDLNDVGLGGIVHLYAGVHC